MSLIEIMVRNSQRKLIKGACPHCGKLLKETVKRCICGQKVEG